MELFGTQSINERGQLEIGGVNVNVLKEKYGTPLYVMDTRHIKDQMAFYNNHFTYHGIDSEVIYASKAFLSLDMVRLIKEQNLSLDVVSGGELYMAKKASFPMDKVYFHGNNKSAQEIEMAIDYGVKTIIIDNPHEFELLRSLMPKDKRIHVLLRVNPGIEAHTHEYIATTKNDSKFGVSIFSNSTMNLIQTMYENSHIIFDGFHSHIGSQIFESDSFLKHATAMMEFVKKVKEDLKIDVNVLNLGGGFGVKYIKSDTPIRSIEFLSELLETVKNYALTHQLTIPKVLIEPGRSITANGGITLYTVGSTKETFSNKNYIFVDGSMADHIRTALYQAKYSALLASNMHLKNEKLYTITGKACESGDIIIKDIMFPTPQKDDLIAVQSTGAYHHSMASNYNMLRRPAVVFVEDGIPTLSIRRETYEDLLIREMG